MSPNLCSHGSLITKELLTPLFCACLNCQKDEKGGGVEVLSELSYVISVSLGGGKVNQGVGKWSLKGQRPRENSLTRFSSWAARKMPGNLGKKERLGGVSGGRRLGAHNACR